MVICRKLVSSTLPFTGTMALLVSRKSSWFTFPSTRLKYLGVALTMVFLVMAVSNRSSRS